MGNSDGEDGGGIGVDWDVGTIVWVRRRNGSWWPGRVLGQEEVLSSHLLSPRSGTPVQLLGREDGSVDWYNLEKSIRVKAFRCGEFDDCIRKAEASHGAPIKKREKYARREDAIRHALELEKKQLETIQNKPGVPTSGLASWSVNPLKRESELSSSALPIKYESITDSEFMEHKTRALPKKSSVMGKDKNLIVNIRKGSKQIRPECYASEALPCTGGMQDFVQGTATKKKPWHFVQGSSSKNKCLFTPKREKSYGCSDLWHSYPSHIEDNPFVASTAGKKQNISFPFQAEENILISVPAYTSDTPGPEGYASEEMSSEMDSLNHFKSLPEDYTCSDTSENNEPESTRRDYLKINMGKITNPLGERFSDLENEAPLSGLNAQLPNQEYEHLAEASADSGVKWHMKGKRKVRSIAKNTFDLTNSKVSISGSGKFNESSRVSQLTSYHGQKQVSYSSRDLHMIDQDIKQEQVDGYNSWAHPSVLKSAMNFQKNSQPGWGTNESSRWNQSAYMEESDECFGPVYHASNSKLVPSTLVKVDLQVKASYQGEHVPLVSLMSRLNGKAIIGHPVQVEILEDGATSQYFCSADTDSDEATAIQPVLRTDRQTVLRCAPHSKVVASAFNLEEGVKERKRTPNKFFGHNVQKTRLMKNSFHREQLSSGIFQKNSFKREALASKNARKAHLSVATGRKRSGRKKYAKANRDNDFLCGLIKPEGSLPSVTCVPVKVAFSRIFEAVGRPSSLSHRVRMTS